MLGSHRKDCLHIGAGKLDLSRYIVSEYYVTILEFDTLYKSRSMRRNSLLEIIVIGISVKTCPFLL